MPVNKPSAEVDLDETVVRRMLVEQCPQWADLPIRFVTAGWDNAMFRLGDDLMVRVPRRAAAVPLIENEQRWLPELAPRLPLPIPAPVYAGTGGDTYPWPWSVVRFAPGRSALDAAIEDGWSDHGVAGSSAVAEALGEFHAALATIPIPEDPPINPYRGMPLADRQDRFDECVEICRSMLGARTIGAIIAAWDESVAAPVAEETTWLHGDLHPGNIVVDLDVDPVAISVVDFGDMCIGDRACDLLVGWQLFSPGARARFQAASAVDDATWVRGRGWALAHGLMCLANSADDAAYTALGRHAIDAVAADLG